MASILAGSQYVAMGSSFGAGPGLTPRAPGSPRRAGRSAGDYAHLVARALRLDLWDVTYSGATTDDSCGRPPGGTRPARGVTRLRAWSPSPVAATMSATYPGSRSRACPGRCGPCRRPGPRSPGSGIPPPPTSGSRASAAIFRRSCAVCGTGPRTARVLFVDYLDHPPRRRRPPGRRRRRDRGLGARHRGPARGHDPRRGGGHRRRVRGGLSGLSRASRLVGDALDAPLPPVAARRRAVPSQRGRDGGGRPGAG